VHVWCRSPRHTYPAVLRALAHVVEGKPQVHPYAVAHVTSTQALLVSQPDADKVLVGGGGRYGCPLACLVCYRHYPLDVLTRRKGENDRGRHAEYREA
jgi:hypothetical protein